MCGRDRISELPECLITQILSYLPIEESTKTSVLAKSWKNHWLHVPVLELNYKDFSSRSVFISFIDTFLQKLRVLDGYSKVGPIPKFNNLSRLQAVFSSSSLQLFPALLENCPNLKHLIWKIVYTEETEEAFQVINVPRCFVATLECVEIEGFWDWEMEELEIASYFLENSAVLKKLVLRFAHYSYPRKGEVTDSDIYEELNKVTKRNRGCQILIDYEAL